jgi:hypothetical protein
LAITLSALDTFYRPYITRRISHSIELWRAARLAFDPAACLRWLDLTVGVLSDAIGPEITVAISGSLIAVAGCATFLTKSLRTAEAGATT